MRRSLLAIDRIWSTLVLALSLACGTTTAGTAPDTSERRVRRAEAEWDVREPRVERHLPSHTQIEPIGFGSGGGLTALVVRSPRAEYQFIYYDPASPFGGLMADERKAPSLLPLRSPSDVVGVTTDGIVLYLDTSTGLVKASTIAGRRAVIVALDTVSPVQSACALDARTFAFVEASRVDTVFVRTVERDTLRAFALAKDARYVRPPRWSDTRLTGAMGSGCALWSPGWHSIVALRDSIVDGIWATRWSKVTNPWYRRAIASVLRLIGRGGHDAPVTARDVTTVPGAVAVLSLSGDLVDLYAMDSGEYVESLRLPRPMLRIAGARSRLFALSQIADTVRLASYALPAATAARELSRPRAATFIEPAWLRAYHAYHEKER